LKEPFLSKKEEGSSIMGRAKGVLLNQKFKIQFQRYFEIKKESTLSNKYTYPK